MRESDIVHAAGSGDSDSHISANTQFKTGCLLAIKARKLEILQGEHVDEKKLAAMWAEALSIMLKAAEQGSSADQFDCGMIYATGERSVPQNWTTALKFWHMAAGAGTRRAQYAQWFVAICYYYGRGVRRDVAKANVWFSKAAAQGMRLADRASHSGIPGDNHIRTYIHRFIAADSAAARHAVVHTFAQKVINTHLKLHLHRCNNALQEFDSVVPHEHVRASVWVEFMLLSGVSDEELQLMKHMYDFSNRSCSFCGSKSTPLNYCSLCSETLYCADTGCLHLHWHVTASSESYKASRRRILDLPVDSAEVHTKVFRECTTEVSIYHQFRRTFISGRHPVFFLCFLLFISWLRLAS